MSAPFDRRCLPGGGASGRSWPPRFGAITAAACAAVVAASALAGVAAGFGWAALAPRPLLVMTGRGMAGLLNVETRAFITADAVFCLIGLAGGVLSGLLGYLLAVRRFGPPAMLAVIAGALAAALTARWTGEWAGLGAFHHLLATLPAGARLRDELALGATGALAFWPLAASLVAGGLVLFGRTGAHRAHARQAAPGRDGPAA
jgi:hypothetical protein